MKNLKYFLMKRTIKKLVYKEIELSKLNNRYGVTLEFYPKINRKDKFLADCDVLLKILFEVSNELKKQNISSWVISRKAKGILYSPESNKIMSLISDFFITDFAYYGWDNFKIQEEYGGYYFIIEWE